MKTMGLSRSAQHTTSTLDAGAGTMVRNCSEQQRRGRSQVRMASPEGQKADAWEDMPGSRSSSPYADIFAFSPAPSRSASRGPLDRARLRQRELDPKGDMELAQRSASVPMCLTTRRGTFGRLMRNHDGIEMYYALGLLTVHRMPARIDQIYSPLVVLAQQGNALLTARDRLSLLAFAAYCSEQTDLSYDFVHSIQRARSFLDVGPEQHPKRFV